MPDKAVKILTEKK